MTSFLACLVVSASSHENHHDFANILGISAPRALVWCSRASFCDHETLEREKARRWSNPSDTNATKDTEITNGVHKRSWTAGPRAYTNLHGIRVDNRPGWMTGRARGIRLMNNQRENPRTDGRVLTYSTYLVSWCDHWSADRLRRPESWRKAAHPLSSFNTSLHQAAEMTRFVAPGNVDCRIESRHTCKGTDSATVHCHRLWTRRWKASGQLWRDFYCQTVNGSVLTPGCRKDSYLPFSGQEWSRRSLWSYSLSECGNFKHQRQLADKFLKASNFAPLVEKL